MKGLATVYFRCKSMNYDPPGLLSVTGIFFLSVRLYQTILYSVKAYKTDNTPIQSSNKCNNNEY